MRRRFGENPTLRLMQNAVSNNSVDDLALNRAVVTSTDHTVSHLLDRWRATNQKKSGRCWLFAGLNLARPGARRRLNVTEFEFSQNYLMFWDKLERANYFLESVIRTLDTSLDDRTVAHLLGNVADDGGQWNMFVALVQKHGLVPKSVMPETQSSSSTGRMNDILRRVLRQGARDLRELGSTDPVALRKHKFEVLTVVHRVLCIHLGTPPERFEWQWTDSDRKFHRDGELTPEQFANKYLDLPLEEYVCLVHDPRPDNPYGRTYTVDMLGNVVGAPPVTYLNVAVEEMKRLAMRTIVGGEPVWFGCDVGKHLRGADLGIWDAQLYDYESVYDTSFTLGKAERLLYGETAMTHAMLFTGVDVVDDSPRKWRVENSWGEKDGDSGFYTMNDSWFDEYVFEIAIRRSALPTALRAALDTEPIRLPAWDPMGALARTDAWL